MTSAAHTGPGRCFYCFEGNKTLTQEAGGAQITLDQIEDLRQAQLQADVTYNAWKTRLEAKGLKMLGMGGGPDWSLRAPQYGARANYATARTGACPSYPCTLAMFDPQPGLSVTWASQAERNASWPAFEAAAKRELHVDNVITRMKLESAAVQEQVLDALWRWDQMGGGPFVIQVPQQKQCSTAPGGSDSFLLPDQCVTKQVAAQPTDNPVYQAARQFQAGGRSSLPRSSAEQPAADPPAACTPACKYGDCVQGECVCWSGASGDGCTTLGPKQNDCNQIVGINLEGISDYSRSWTFRDAMKIGRQWFALNPEYGWDKFVALNATQMDADGYPLHLNGTNPKDGAKLSAAGTLIARDLQGHFPSGRYTLLWDGEGVVNVAMEVVELRIVSANSIDVTVKLTTQFNNGIWVTVERTNPANPVRNMRLLMPGVDASEEASGDVTRRPFMPQLKQFVSRFSAIRFMVGAAPWLSLPYSADDDYFDALQSNYSAQRDTTLDKFLQETLPMQAIEAHGMVRPHAEVAAQHGKQLVAYKAGQGIGGAYMAGLVENNMSQIMHFDSVGAWGKYGYWGLKEWMDVEDSTQPKIQGIKAFIGSLALEECPDDPPPPPGGDDFIDHFDCGYYCTF
ncbi:PA14 domain-containing [Micractinium conductrix]|uniref:PA14 domain-containing n=1 Tax=Micractinium conductrix TaxID=554055 RepID=A0A2P6VRT1_9CHLO|nr:PA14 domain-containing [Micractinium conductrix]|eukprot:PSC76808.1 PA14 domain-containing [Micractinium conductrix]